MPKATDVPVKIRPLVFHGLDLDWSSGTQAVGGCPFCGKERKFFSSLETGLWDCKSCGKKGNALTFVRELWDESDRTTQDYSDLAADRGLLYPETLMAWGACRSVVDGMWMLPGYDAKGKVCTLYRYTSVYEKGKWVMRLLATTDLPHGYHRPTEGWDAKRGSVYVAEGPWDAMVLWEVMRVGKESDGGLTLTGNPDVSLLSVCSVVAAPGANVFPKEWSPLFANKRVSLLYDSDHPREHPLGSKKFTQSGYDGMRRAAELMAAAAGPPSEIGHLKWGLNGHDPSLKSGYDVRDALTAGRVPTDRLFILGKLLGKILPIPDEWVAGRSKLTVKSGGTGVEPLACTTWKECHNAWRKSMDFVEGLNHGLVAILATMTSTDSPGDQIFLRLIGPPSCGKSTLCEAVSIDRKWAFPRDDVTMLVSGFQTDAGGTENQSALLKMNHKTLIIKEANPLLKAGNKDQILAQFRSIYDRAFRKQFGNKMSVDLDDLSTTVVIAGTDALRSMDSSELGERFLTVEIMAGVDDDLDRRIGTRAAFRAYEMLRGGTANTSGHTDADMLLCKRLTAGYVSYLRENADDLLSRVEASPATLERITAYGMFVSYMRARPAPKTTTAEREMCARLVGQFTRFAMCVAVVLNKDAVDGEVMLRLRKVVMDSAAGATLDLARVLSDPRHRPLGCEVKSLALLVHHADSEIRRMLQFLRRIGAVEHAPEQELKAAGVTGASKRWRLSSTFQTLYDEVTA